MQRRVRQHHAQARISRRDAGGDAGSLRGAEAARWAARSPRAARGPHRSTRTAVRQPPSRTTMIANAFPLRRLRSRSSLTARSLAASQARWNPPRPLIARIRPSRRSTRARSSISRALMAGSKCGARARGELAPPREAPAKVRIPDKRSARRETAGSSGSSYSAWQRAHIGNCAMVVFGRS